MSTSIKFSDTFIALLTWFAIISPIYIFKNNIYKARKTLSTAPVNMPSHQKYFYPHIVPRSITQLKAKIVFLAKNNKNRLIIKKRWELFQEAGIKMDFNGTIWDKSDRMKLFSAQVQTAPSKCHISEAWPQLIWGNIQLAVAWEIALIIVTVHLLARPGRQAGGELLTHIQRNNAIAT